MFFPKTGVGNLRPVGHMRPAWTTWPT